MEKLREAIKDVPCNSLSRVYPYQLQEWTDVMSGEEFEEVVQELIDENLLDEKYDFQCDCGNECTVYASKLLENGYCCPECEREYGKEEVINKGTVVYDIDKRAAGLIIVVLIPIFFNGVFGAQVSFGGTSIIIIVGVILETLKQIESQMLVRNYKGFLSD